MHEGSAIVGCGVLVSASRKIGCNDRTRRGEYKIRIRNEQTRLQFRCAAAAQVRVFARKSFSEASTPGHSWRSPSYSRASLSGEAFKEKFVPSAEAAKALWNSSRLPFGDAIGGFLALSKAR